MEASFPLLRVETLLSISMFLLLEQKFEYSRVRSVGKEYQITMMTFSSVCQNKFNKQNSQHNKANQVTINQPQ